MSVDTGKPSQSGNGDEAMKLRSIDLNLLVVLDALVEERHVGRASERIGLSASATSHALDRLRKLLGDPLLIRTSTGMEPTPRALELAGPMRHALLEIEAALAPPQFDPASADTEFTLAIETYETIVIQPRLIDLLHREAPKVRLKVTLGSLEDILGGVDQGRTDVAIGRFNRLPDRFMTSRLLKDDFVCVTRDGHPLTGRPLTMDAYLSADHVFISLGGAEGDAIDAALATHGLKRHIAMQLPHGLAAVMALARTDMIATVTRGAARLFGVHAALGVHELPFDVAASEFRLVWHRRLAQSPAHRWLRQHLAGIGQTVERELRGSA
jgi:DNA-binding transcriptional LysR family regulator